jgi:hypothetical protein
MLLERRQRHLDRGVRPATAQPDFERQILAFALFPGSPGGAVILIRMVAYFVVW